MALRDELITVFGASGFIGRYVVRRLAKAGYRVRAATRRPHLAHELKPMGVVGQIQLVQANLRHEASIARAVDGASGVVNLVGILAQSGPQRFDTLQAEGPEMIARAAKAQNIDRFVQVSAIGAEENSSSVYARTKGQGERAVLDTIPSATVLRPSIVFGPEDQFFNKFAQMARTAPALPLIGGGKTRFQPVYCDDVAECVLKAIESPAYQGKTYELGGPGVYSFKQLLEFVLETLECQRALMPIPFPIASLMGFGGEIIRALPFIEPFLTRDQVKLLRHDNVVGAGGPGLGTIEDFDIKPETIEAIVPGYLYRFKKGGRFADAPGPAAKS